MPKYDLEWAIGKLSQLNPDQKINTMLVTAEESKEIAKWIDECQEIL